MAATAAAAVAAAEMVLRGEDDTPLVQIRIAFLWRKRKRLRAVGYEFIPCHIGMGGDSFKAARTKAARLRKIGQESAHGGC